MKCVSRQAPTAHGAFIECFYLCSVKCANSINMNLESFSRSWIDQSNCQVETIQVYLKEVMSKIKRVHQINYGLHICIMD